MTNDNDRTKIVEQPTPLRWGCVLHQCEDSKWLVSNARGTHWWYSFDEIWEVEPCNFQRGWADTSDEALKDFAKCQTPPPDWTEPEQPERFDEATGGWECCVCGPTCKCRPTTDPAAHTTPGQSTDISPTMPEMLEIANATCLSFQHLELALTRYGLRAYKAGQDYVLNHLKGQNR